MSQRLDRIEALTARIAARLDHETPRMHSTLYRSIDALMATYHYLDPSIGLPPMAAPYGGWEITPNLARVLCELDARYQPTTVVDLGSGTSTVLMAMLLSKREGTRLVSVDHDPVWYAKTLELLDLAGVGSVAELRFAPLEELIIGDESFEWYEQSAFDDLVDIDLILVDGPPGSIGPLARFPAGPVLTPRTRAGAIFVLDDTIRDLELEIMTRWETELGMETLERHEWHNKGAAVLRAKGPNTSDQ